MTFARSEGIIPAPETAHAIKAAIDEAMKCKETGEEKCIAFNFSGHGHFDLAAYDSYLSGEMVDYAHPDEALCRSLADLPQVSD